MKNLYFELCKGAILNDLGWPYISYKKVLWERIDEGVWQNLQTKMIAVKQPSGIWVYNSNTFKSIKDCIYS